MRTDPKSRVIQGEMSYGALLKNLLREFLSAPIGNGKNIWSLIIKLVSNVSTVKLGYRSNPRAVRGSENGSEVISFNLQFKNFANFAFPKMLFFN
jgi:hypothetical protein